MGINVNDYPIKENLEKKINTGTFPDVHPLEDFFIKDVGTNSWFGIGHFESEGHTLSFLLHFMTIIFGPDKAVLNVNQAITDETDKIFIFDDKIFPLDTITLEEVGEGDEKVLNIVTPVGSLRGTLEKAHWESTMERGKISIDMEAVGLPIYNAGSGHFRTLLENMFSQYSVPHLKSKGSLTLDGKEYTVKGYSWMDRQWQIHGEDALTDKWNWSWMDLNLDNGDVISLWEMHNMTKGLLNSWATVQHPDGTQAVLYMKPLCETATRYTFNEPTGNYYPTQYEIEIPEIDAKLKIDSIIEDQVIVSSLPFVNKYEGASTIDGTYKGKAVKGFCYIELLGDFTEKH